MKYIISYQNPHQHYIDIEFIANNINTEKTLVQLPAWRPGRYELANFAKNIQKWKAFDENGNALDYKKINKDLWSVTTKGVKTLHIKYNYFAFEINAGSTYLDESQLYVNPVNCCLFIPDRINKACELEIIIPENYIIASGLTPVSNKSSNKKNIYTCIDYHQLVDSPFIASSTLQTKSYTCKNINFHIWFQGECKPDWEKLIADFEKFTFHQLEMMDNFPVKEYHFLFQILPIQAYHGVEHITSTVISLGPGCNLMNDSLYDNLLGVSCHELFHVWNVKTIRPVDMEPYDYTKENYSKLGYVYEGVTTYYGDYLLLRSKVFSEEQYLETFNDRLQKHFDNLGRFNLSVADSSFDTWLDGYAPGIPNRKTNIYTEGCLLAFITDMFIRKHSNNKHSLDDVLRHLNSDFAMKNKGYTEKDYKGLIEHYANTSFDEIFNNYYNNVFDYEPLLIEAMDFIGHKLIKLPSSKFYEHAIGIKIIESNGVVKVISVFPNSVADESGISLNDEILSINNILLGKGILFNDWCKHFESFNKQSNSYNELQLTLNSSSIIKQIKLKPKAGEYYQVYKMKKDENMTKKQMSNYELWSKNSV